MMRIWDCGMQADCCWYGQSETCGRGEVQLYTVNATSAEHVQESVRFATEQNIALSVKATGHDYQGRSTSKDRLTVWLHHMKEVVYIEDFVPKDCSSEPTRAMQDLGGDQWVDVYKEADRQNVNIVGGNA